MSSSATAKPRPGRPKDPARRQHVVDCAGTAFAELGYAGASLGEIAVRAELTKAAILHHFDSKQALYLAVMTETLGSLGALVSAAASDPGDHVARLDRLGGTVVDYLGAHPAAAKLLLSELIGRGPFARGHGRPMVDAILRAVAAFLGSGMRAGAFASQPADHLAMSIIGTHLVYFAAHDLSGTLVGGDPFEPRRLARRKKAVLASVRAMCLPR